MLLKYLFMDLSVFFRPVVKFTPIPSIQPEIRLGQQVISFEEEFPDWKNADIILFSASLRDHEQFPALLRKELFSLSSPHSRLTIADLGHLNPRDVADDLLEQLSYILSILRQHDKVCLLLLDDPLLSLAQAYAFEGSDEPLEYVHIDSQFNLLDSDLLLDGQSYHHALLQEVPNWLFDFTHLGYQKYFVSEEQIEWFKTRGFSTLRYGQLMGNIQLAEPYLRTAQAVSADLSAIRASDAPAASVSSSGGFSAEEFCRLARYSGLGYHTKSFSLFGWKPDLDHRSQTTRMAAMAYWYFLDGFSQRFDDYPAKDRSNLTRYSVQLHASIQKIDFFKHPRTERWWMEVPYQEDLGEEQPATKLVACNEQDYEFAKHDDIPERWWMIYQKLRKKA